MSLKCVYWLLHGQTGSCRLFSTVIRWQEKRLTIPDGFFSSFNLLPNQPTLRTHLHISHQVPCHSWLHWTMARNRHTHTQNKKEAKTKQKFINCRTASGQRDTTMSDPELWISDSTCSNKTWSILSRGFLAPHAVIKPGLSWAVGFWHHTL